MRYLPLILLVIPLMLLAEPPAQPAPIGMPDVRANVMKMLQQGRQKGTALVIEQPPGTVTPTIHGEALPAAEEPVEDLFSLVPAQPEADTGEVTPQANGLEEAPAALEKKRREAGTPPPADDGHVPLPNKTITIRDLRDIEGLSRELEEAKQRRQR